MEKEFYAMSFESTHYAIMMEKKLKEKHETIMIPTPREITASCGLSLKIPVNLIDNVLNDLRTWDVDTNMFGIYKIDRTKEESYAEKIIWQE